VQIGLPGSPAQPVEEKTVSYMRKEFRATAEQRNRPPLVAEAMVDADVEIPEVIEKGKLLTLTTKEALQVNVADFQANSLEAVLEFLNLADAEIYYASETWAESLVRFLTHPVVSSLLMTVGILGIVAVIAFDLKRFGSAVLGEVPAGLPVLHFATLNLNAFRNILGDAAGLVLISFTSGVLTAKSFARRNRYEIDSNQELFAFGACNLASGLGQGFPVTGADSRTAVNDAMGGKTQLVGIIAGLTMLLVLLFFTGPLADVPNSALAAVIMVSAVGLLDIPSWRDLFQTSHREFFLSVITTLGVLILGALPGVILTVGLTLLWLLTVAARPHGAIL
jgi:MFS superfamily sulfate permease-like transporter